MLRRPGSLLGGVEANWPVASTEESADIERRRVFQPVTVDAARAGKIVSTSYGEQHATRAREFPFECRERDCLRRIETACPKLPERFDGLLGDGSKLASGGPAKSRTS